METTTTAGGGGGVIHQDSEESFLPGVLVPRPPSVRRPYVSRSCGNAIQHSNQDEGSTTCVFKGSCARGDVSSGGEDFSGEFAMGQEVEEEPVVQLSRSLQISSSIQLSRSPALPLSSSPARALRTSCTLPASPWRSRGAWRSMDMDMVAQFVKGSLGSSSGGGSGGSCEEAAERTASRSSSPVLAPLRGTQNLSVGGGTSRASRYSIDDRLLDLLKR